MTERALYLGMVGAKEAMYNMRATSNNIANVNTSGYRADIPLFSSQQILGEGYPSRYFDVTPELKPDMSQGTSISTGRDLDVAISGSGLIAVQTKGGLEGYTRNGGFNRSPEGFLTTSSGNYVLGQRGLITIPPAQRINIGKDGTISIQGLGQNEKDITIVDKVKLVNPPQGQIIRGEDGLFYGVGNESFDIDNNVQVESGFLESSNVNVAQELVNMIDHSRQFELQVKMMKTVDENEQVATKIVSNN